MPNKLFKNNRKTRNFNVNARGPIIESTLTITLKEGELSELNWDNKLLLEFLGTVAIQKIEITPILNTTTLVLIGDSTVNDQDLELWASWVNLLLCIFYLFINS